MYHYELFCIKTDNALLEYYYARNQRSWIIQYIKSFREGHGHAQQVVKEFVNTIGNRQRVLATIIEAKTVNTLEELGLIAQALTTSKLIRITDYSILQQLHIVRVLTGGGLKVENIQLQNYPGLDKNHYDPEDGIKYPNLKKTLNART